VTQTEAQDNVYTLTRTEISTIRSRLGDVVLQRDKVGPSGNIMERNIVMFTSSETIKLELEDE